MACRFSSGGRTPAAVRCSCLIFPHATPAEMPPLVLPRSHLRRVSYHYVTRYKNFRGQVQLAGGGGRIAFMHESLWHCAQPNTTDKWRFMFKIRYQSKVPQRALFDVEGWDDPETHAFFNDARRRHLWVGDGFPAMGRKRLNWWRYLAGATELANVSGVDSRH